MKPTRTSQPYRAGPRSPSPTLAAMLKGSTAHGHNPMNPHRRALKMAAKRRKARKTRFY
jgi:hypothetical protein